MLFFVRSSLLARTGATVAFITVAGACLTACQQTPIDPAVPVEYRGPTLPIAQSDRGVQIFLPSATLFETGKSTLNATDSAAYMQRVAQLINTKTNKNVVLEGHTDNVGKDGMNQELSEARARSVREALLAQGVDAKRLSTIGFSFMRPVASNATEDGRKLNRRVEVVILDEKVENITRGEAPNAFENAWDRLKALMDKGLIQPVLTQ